MSCQDFRFQITASLDSSLSEQESHSLTAHLMSCDSCAQFHEEQFSLNQLLTSPELELEPPESIWNSISREISVAPTASGTSMKDRWVAWLQELLQPAPGYGLAGLAALLVFSLALFQLPSSPDPSLLAALDHYTVERVGSDNPFLTAESALISTQKGSNRGNPFAEFRRRA